MTTILSCDIIDYLNSVIQGESSSSCIVTIKVGSSTFSEEIFKLPCEKECLKACELLAKFYELDNSTSVSTTPVIVDDICNYFFSSEVPIMSSCDSTNKFDSIVMYLSSVMLGKSSSTILVSVKEGSDTYSSELVKSPSEEERLRACELLIKLMQSSTATSTCPTNPVIMGVRE